VTLKSGLNHFVLLLGKFRRRGSKRRWSEEENNELERIFKINIQCKSNPTGKDIARARAGALSGRSVEQIRTKINNIIRDKQTFRQN